MDNWSKQKNLFIVLNLCFIPHLLVILFWEIVLTCWSPSSTSANTESQWAFCYCNLKSLKSQERSWAGYKCLRKQSLSLQNFQGKNIALVVCERQCTPVAFQKTEVSSTSKVRRIPIRNCCFQMAIARRQQPSQWDSLTLVGVFLCTSTAYKQILKVCHQCLLSRIVSKGRGFLKDNWQWWNFLSVLVSDVCLLFEADFPETSPHVVTAYVEKEHNSLPSDPPTVADLYFANTLNYSHALYHWFFFH